MKYVIRIGNGYYGKKPFSKVPRSEAIVFDSKKEASRIQNRLNGRLLKGNLGVATVEKI